MPVIGSVTALRRADLGTAGEYLRAAGDGGLELADLVAVPVGSGGEIAEDAGLDELLAAGPAGGGRPAARPAGPAAGPAPPAARGARAGGGAGGGRGAAGPAWRFFSA